MAAQKEQHLKDMAKRTHPKSNSDFVVLYNELDQWRQAEIAKIKVPTWAWLHITTVAAILDRELECILITLSRLLIQATVSDPEARKEAMAALLQNETKALQSMQMLKMNAQRELHSEKTQQMLERMAQPHQWQVCTLTYYSLLKGSFVRLLCMRMNRLLTLSLYAHCGS